MYVYSTKKTTMLIAALIIGFIIISYSLHIWNDLLFWFILFILFSMFINMFGITYRITESKLMIFRFSYLKETINIEDIKFLTFFGRAFSIPIQGGKVLLFWGVEAVDVNKILKHINGVVNHADNNKFKIICANRKLLKELIQNFFLIILLSVSGYKIGIHSEEVNIGLYLIAFILFLTSIKKISCIQK